MNSNDIRKILGSSLKELRTAKGLTQEQLAERIGKQTNTVNRIETGMNFVKSETLAELCNVLNVHPSILFTSRPEIVLKEHVDSIKAITQLLQTFPKDKLKDAYNILNALNK